MAMTLGDALTNLRDRLNEPTEATWSNASLRRYVNEGLRECSRRSEGWRDSVVVPITADTADYLLTGTDVVRFSSQVYFQPTGETSRIPIEYQDQAALDRIWGSDMVRQTGYPSYWTTEGFGTSLAIRLFPVPSVDGNLIVYYYRFATELLTDGSDDGDNLDCPTGWEDTVIDWAAYRAYLAKHMTDLAQLALGDFSQHLAGLTEATTRYTDATTQMIQDRADLSMLGDGDGDMGLNGTPPMPVAPRYPTTRAAGQYPTPPTPPTPPTSPGKTMGAGSGALGAMPRYGSQQYQDALNGAFGAVYPQHWADVAQIGLGQQSARDRYQFDVAGQNLDRNRLQSNFNLGSRELDLQNQSLGFDRERNELRRQGIGFDRADIGAQRGFNQRNLDMSLMESLAQGVRKTRANNSEATSRGAWFAPMRGIRNDDIRFDTQLAGDQARLSFDKANQGLNLREQNLGLDEKSIDIANRELDAQAQKIGLSRDQLRATLDQGIAALGLQGQISTNQLMNGLASGDLQHAQLIQGILQDIIRSGMAGDFMTDGRGGSVLQNLFW